MLDIDDVVKFDEIGQSSIDPSYPVRIPASGKALAAFNPVDENKFAIIRVAFNSWQPPQGSDGNSVSWVEKWQYFESRRRWFRVVEFTNEADRDISVSVTLRLI